MLSKFLNVFRPNKLDQDLREELEFHRLQTAGHFGNSTLIQDRARDASTIVWLATLLQDLRYGLRQLRRAPVLVATAVVSLALGIGANTAIFTLINAVMLQSLPVAEPERLVLFNDGINTGTRSGDDVPGNEFSFEFYQYLKIHNDSFADLCAFRQGNDRVVMHVSGSNDSAPWERARVHLVSGNYFTILGVGASAGRVLEPSDDSIAVSPVAVLSYAFWRDRFNSESPVLGRTVVLNGTSFTIVGVAAREFFGERIEPAPEFWLPLSFQPQILKSESFVTARDVFWLNLLGRLKPGLSAKRAQAAVNVALHRLYLDRAGASIPAERRRKIEDVRIQLTPGGRGISGLRFLYSKPLHLLMAVVFIVLLIACANVATLLLARATVRRPEFLARMALGASHSRLLRQVLTESVLLAFIAGVVGLGFAWWSVRLLVLFLHVSSVVKVSPNSGVLASTFALCILTGLLFGILPALELSRTDLSPGNATQSSPGRKWRFGSAQALIASQVALSLILLVSSGLLAHSLFALENQEIGFRRNNILLIKTDPSLAGYQQNEYFRVYKDLVDRLSGVPGVISASLGRFTPLSGSSSSGNFSLEGYNPSAGLKLSVYDLPVAPRFFETLEIPLLLGRTFNVRDTPVAPAVAVVNQSFVNVYLPTQNPIGRHMMLGAPFKAPGVEIVGVVADSRFYDLHDKAPPMVFFPIWQKPYPLIEVVLRTSKAPTSMIAAVRTVFKQLDTRLPILDTLTLEARIDQSLKQQKMVTALCGAFAVLAILLSSVGIYGTLSYSVAGRTKELGLRMAIGADRRNVIWLVLREALVLIGLGLCVGLPLAVGGTRLIRGFLYGVGRVDPLAVGSAISLVLILALLASYLPARRAARIDPMRALRQG